MHSMTMHSMTTAGGAAWGAVGRGSERERMMRFTATTGHPCSDTTLRHPCSDTAEDGGHGTCSTGPTMPETCAQSRSDHGPKGAAGWVSGVGEEGAGCGREARKGGRETVQRGDRQGRQAGCAGRAGDWSSPGGLKHAQTAGKLRPPRTRELAAPLLRRAPCARARPCGRTAIRAALNHLKLKWIRRTALNRIGVISLRGGGKG